MYDTLSFEFKKKQHKNVLNLSAIHTEEFCVTMWAPANRDSTLRTNKVYTMNDAQQTDSYAHHQMNVFIKQIDPSTYLGYNQLDVKLELFFPFWI